VTELLPHPTDLQTTAPDVALALEDVGVLGVRRAVAFDDGSRGMASIDVAVDLPADRKGVHMSRFHEAIAQAVDEVSSRGREGARVGTGEGDVAAPGGPDLLAARIATLAAHAQGARTARVTVRDELELVATTPASKRASFDPVSATGHAVVDVTRGRVHRALEVHATGMNACPCAQELVRAQAHERLRAAGFSGEQAARALASIPIATHNQLGTGTLTIGSESIVSVADAAAVVRGAMSAHVHELLKRQDELAVVEQAHATPRFVEDCVRDLLAGALAAGWDLADGDLLVARQVNHESIHHHDVSAQRGALVGELRAELAGGNAPAVTRTLHQWLAPSAS
jgi:GTP cyclohydrolase I/GTP cyclohydrolase-4